MVRVYGYVDFRVQVSRFRLFKPWGLCYLGFWLGGLGSRVEAHDVRMVYCYVGSQTLRRHCGPRSLYTLNPRIGNGLGSRVWGCYLLFQAE